MAMRDRGLRYREKLPEDGGAAGAGHIHKVGKKT